MVGQLNRHKISNSTRIGIWLAGILTALVGFVDIWSAATPSLASRTAWLVEIFPFEVRAGAHLFSAFCGFFLLTLATNILKRKRLAWLLTITLLICSIFAHLIKGLDYEEATLSFVLLLQLLWLRPAFTVRSDRPSIVQGIRVLFIATLFILTYGTFGFWLQERHFSTSFDLSEAIVQTFRMFVTLDYNGVQPENRFGKYFIESIYIISSVSLLYAAWMLFRPVILRSEASREDRLKAKTIVEQYGCSSLARFTLLKDKSYFFSPSDRSVIAYVPKGGGAVALGDVIGPQSDRKEAILSFCEFCNRNGWHPAFYQTLTADLETYTSLGFSTLKIGEEAVVDLTKFSLKGRANRNLRTAMNKLTKQDYQVRYYTAPVSNDVLAELKVISNDWLKLVNGAEKKFSIGWFYNQYLRSCDIAVVEDGQGKPVAFANLISEYQKNEATIDMMRHRSDAAQGTMDFLFVSLLQHAQSQGYDSFNFGLVILTGLGEDAQGPKIEKGIKFLSKHLSQFYNFQGLRAYKDKFHPDWESRYLIYPYLAALPEVIVALVRADSGDRLGDYFGARFLSTTLTNILERISGVLPLLLSIGIFGLSIQAILSELRQYTFQDIVNGISAIPTWAAFLAIFLTVANYICLTGYDALALKFIRQPLPYSKTAWASTISYAISNSVGLSLLSGSAIRYHFYGKWGLTPGKIAQVIAFCNLSFWIGLFAVGGIVFSLEPLAVPDILHLPFDTVHPLGILFSVLTIAYIIFISLSRKSINVMGWVLPRMPLKLCLGQILVTSVDWALAAAVLYVLLPSHPDLNFAIFFGSYLFAQAIGVISNVPGALGVFETIMLLLLSPPLESSEILGSLLVYRVIYYLMPLLVGGGLFAFNEWHQLKARDPKVSDGQ